MMGLKQFTDEQLNEAFANSNFGSQSKRDTIIETLSKIARGYHSGSFSMAIVSELGLTTCSSGHIALTELGLLVLLSNSDQVKSLEKERDKLSAAYWDLLQHIEAKTPGKTRHETAVDILKARNENLNGCGKEAAG